VTILILVSGDSVSNRCAVRALMLLEWLQIEYGSIDERVSSAEDGDKTMLQQLRDD
jgi:hypothetical protein